MKTFMENYQKKKITLQMQTEQKYLNKNRKKVQGYWFKEIGESVAIWQEWERVGEL